MHGKCGLSFGMFGMVMLVAPIDLTRAATVPEPSPPHQDLWEKQADGLERAKQAIEQCLTPVGERLTPPAQCIRAASTACEQEHGTSQHGLNDCSAFSYEAWKARIADTMASFASARRVDTRLGVKTGEAKRQLVESQRRWRKWNALDCEVQAKGTEGGSIRPFTKSICLSDHAAARAIDLQRLIGWWLS